MCGRVAIWGIVAVAIAGMGCSPPSRMDAEPPGSESYRAMTLDERVHVHTEILAAKAKAKKDAAKKHPPFQSQESALKNTDYRNALTEEALTAIEAKYDLERRDIKLIEGDYFRSRGVPLRE